MNKLKFLAIEVYCRNTNTELACYNCTRRRYSYKSYNTRASGPTKFQGRPFGKLAGANKIGILIDICSLASPGGGCSHVRSREMGLVNVLVSAQPPPRLPPHCLPPPYEHAQHSFSHFKFSIPSLSFSPPPPCSKLSQIASRTCNPGNWWNATKIIFCKWPKSIPHFLLVSYIWDTNLEELSSYCLFPSLSFFLFFVRSFG